MKKRFLILALCFALILTMFSVVSVSAWDLIYNVGINVTVPVAGETASYTAILDDGDAYRLNADDDNYNVKNGICWRDNTTGIDFDADGDEQFVAGHEYVIEIHLTFQPGYKFADEATYFVNGKTAQTSWGDDEYRTLTYTFKVPEPTKEITSIKITDVVEPVAGKNPSYTAKLSEGLEIEPNSMAGEDGVVNGKRWWDAGTLVALKKTGTFKKNWNYNFNIWVKVKDGYTFAYTEDEDGDRYYTGKATINGKPANVTMSSLDPNNASVNIQFSTKPSMANCKVSGLATKTYTGSAIYQSLTVKLDGKTLKKGTDYTLSYTNNKNVGKAKVTINGKGNYQGSRTLAFTIRPKSTSITSVSGSSKAFTVKWSKRTTQTTGYQIRYSTSSSFSSYKTVTVTSNTTVSKKISSLKAKKKYYVKVRTYKTVDGTKYYSLFSAKKYVTTK